MQNIDDQQEQRQINDRRSEPTPSFSKYSFFKGRRTTPRRTEERRTNYFVDKYSKRIFAVVLILLCMSLLDAIFTIQLLQQGAAEVNPVMAHFLEYGPLEFMVAKYLLTCASVLLLLIYNNAYLFRTKIRAKYLFIVFIALFTSVIIWEIYLISTTS